MLARCAAASIPRASPDTIANPASPSSWASRAAILPPAADALREPTIATIGCASSRALPRTEIRDGASSMLARARGYSGSCKPTSRTSSARSASISRSASARRATRVGRFAPPRLASVGNASSAAPALPNDRMRARNVRGPTFSLRMSRSQSIRSWSLRRSPACAPVPHIDSVPPVDRPKWFELSASKCRRNAISSRRDRERFQ